MHLALGEAAAAFACETLGLANLGGSRQVAGGMKGLDVIGYVANYGEPLAVVGVEFWQMGSVFRGKRGLSDVQTRAALLEFG